MVITTGGSLQRKRGNPVLFYTPSISSLTAGKNGCADPTELIDTAKLLQKNPGESQATGQPQLQCHVTLVCQFMTLLALLLASGPPALEKWLEWSG